MTGRVSVKQIYYICLGLWSFLFAVCGCTRIETIGGISAGTIYNIVWLLIFIVLLVIMIMTQKGKKLLLSFFFLALGLLTGQNSGYMGYMLPAIAFVVAGKESDVDHSVRTLFKAQLISMMVIIILAVAGIIPNYTTVRQGTDIVRYSMGYYHPNTFGTVVIQLCLMHWFIHRKDRKLIYSAVYAIVAIIVYSLTDSMTTTALFFLLVCFSLYCSLTQKKIVKEKTARRLKWLMIVPIVLSLGIAIWGTNDYSGSNSLSTLFFRFESMQQYWKVYGLTMFGQPLTLSYAKTGYLFTLDNSYMFMLLGFGLIMSLVFVYEYIKTIRLLISTKEIVIIMILLIVAIQGFAEASFMRFGLNFTMILWTYVFGIKFKKCLAQANN